MQHGLLEKKTDVPTVKEFAPRFIDAYARANRMWIDQTATAHLFASVDARCPGTVNSRDRRT